jgi:NAD(P)H-nitrite reductase large subunit
VKIVIVGNGIAGVMIAAKLRELEPDPQTFTIEIYTREPYEYYSRVRLPEVFASGLKINELELYKPGWYDKRNIGVYKNMEVVRLHRGDKQIELRNEIRVPYDKLVLAMGSDSLKPSVPNVNLHGVFTVREYGDAEALRRYISSGTNNAVVIGGGLLGLEAARHMVASGIKNLTIVEAAPRLLPKQLDEEASAILKELVERWPCRVLLGSELVEFLGELRVHSLRLKTGEVLDAQTVLIAIGILPRIQLCGEAGLIVNRGVVVNEYLCSSDPDIYIAGDLVEFQGVVWGIIPAALDHAPVVANNILGRTPIPYHQTIPINTLKVAGISLTSMGKISFSETERRYYQIISKTSKDRRRYEKYITREGVLVGSILLGSKENVKFINQRTGRNVSSQELQGFLRWD